MLNEDVYDHSVKNLELIETHISWVILTGEYAYKIKKPVNFGFLDFSTLDKRHQFCEQEIFLNCRLAPGIYLGVVPITGTQDKPHISGSGEAFEYAVKMRQFPQSIQMDNMLIAGELKAEHMDALACVTAEFHQRAESADGSMDYGEKHVVYQPVEENFKQIHEHINTENYEETLSSLAQWSHAEFIKLGPLLEQRKHDGFTRQCHGDMHLRNLIWFNNQAMAFDCIEFNPYLSWIDVISEVAFLIMDLQSRNEYRFANRFINSYLQITGDYAGLALMPFYLCYRALVRAKVDALRIEQKDCPEEESVKTRAEFELYLQLATTYTYAVTPKLIIMHGLSAVGKSTLSQQLIDEMGIMRIRSDVERKRLFNVAIESSASSSINNDLYTPQASQQTYGRLLELAEHVLVAGYSVIVDAAFLQYEQREIFQTLAKILNVPYIILQLTAPVDVLKKRILERQDKISDADITVLEHQISNMKPFHKNEMNSVIHLNTDVELDFDKLKLALEARV